MCDNPLVAISQSLRSQGHTDPRPRTGIEQPKNSNPSLLGEPKAVLLHEFTLVATVIPITEKGTRCGWLV